MKNDNLSFLQENLRYLGFGESETLANDLVLAAQKGYKEFELTTETAFDERCKIRAVLSIHWSENLEAYFLLKYTASLFYSYDSLQNRKHTFYIVNGSGVTFKEAFNLLQGRSVNKDFTDSDRQKYNAWIRLDFEERMPNGDYRVRQFRAQHGYDLGKVLLTYPIRELEDETLKLNLIRSLKKGNIHPVTFVKANKLEKVYVQACPEFKRIIIYSEAVRIAQHLRNN